MVYKESERRLSRYLTLHRYFLQASRNRSLFLAELQDGDPEGPRARLHLELWYACLVPVLEGWVKEKINNPPVTAFMGSAPPNRYASRSQTRRASVIDIAILTTNSGKHSIFGRSKISDLRRSSTIGTTTGLSRRSERRMRYENTTGWINCWT